MGTAMTVPGADTMPALPPELMEFFETQGNVQAKSTVPTLGITGKIWTISVDGTKTPLMGTDPRTGDEAPLPVFRAIILDYNKRRGRAYYEGAYDPDQVKMPVCWSEDGIKPDDSVEKKQHPTCEGCKWAKKGSRVTDNNKATKACSEHRMLVVVPSNRPDYTPLRLKLAITSDWDKERGRAADGYMAFSQYLDELRDHKVPHTAMVITKMKFDTSVAFPKILFSREDWVPADNLKKVTEVVGTEPVKKLLGGTYTPNGADGTEKHKQIGTTTDVGDEADASTAEVESQTNEAAQQATEAEAKAAADAKAKADAKAARKAEAARLAAEAARLAAEADEDDEDDETPAAAAPPPPAAAPATNGTAAAAPAAAPKANKPAVAAPKAAPLPTDVAAILGDWG